MKRSLLLSLLTLAAHTSFATNEPSLMNALAAPVPYNNGLEYIERVSLFFSLSGGYAGGAYSGVSASGKGLGGKIEAGAKVPINANRGSNSQFLSIGLGYKNVHISTGDISNTVAGQPKYKIDNDFIYYVLPVSYNSMNASSRGSAAFYWQLGLELAYLNSVKDNTANHKDISKGFSTVVVSPFASAGVSFGFELHQWATHRTVGRGRMMIGPYVEYSGNNIYKSGPVSLHTYIIGLQYTTIYF